MKHEASERQSLSYIYLDKCWNFYVLLTTNVYIRRLLPYDIQNSIITKNKYPYNFFLQKKTSHMYRKLCIQIQ